MTSNGLNFPNYYLKLQFVHKNFTKWPNLTHFSLKITLCDPKWPPNFMINFFFYVFVIFLSKWTYIKVQLEFPWTWSIRECSPLRKSRCQPRTRRSRWAWGRCHCWVFCCWARLWRRCKTTSLRGRDIRRLWTRAIKIKSSKVSFLRAVQLDSVTFLADSTFRLGDEPRTGRFLRGGMLWSLWPAAGGDNAR